MKNAMTQKQKTLILVQLAMLVALVVVLQLLSALIPPIGGMVSITLTLIPIVIGGILFGVKGGAILGFAFGLIVMINCITALDPGGNILWNANPFFTALICLVKGTMAGVVPAIVYSALVKTNDVSAKRKFFATVLAAMLAPLVNTSLFVLGMFGFFSGILSEWATAAGKPIALYILVGLAGINFLVEFAVNVILTPAISRIVEIVKRKRLT